MYLPETDLLNLLEDFNLEPTASNRVLVKLNFDLLQHKHLLYKLHLTYPNLYYYGEAHIGPPSSLKIEPPPRSLFVLDHNIDHNYFSFNRKYGVILKTDNLKVSTGIRAKTSAQNMLVQYVYDLDNLFPKFYSEKDMIWMRCGDYCVSASWEFKSRTLILKGLREYHEI